MGRLSSLRCRFVVLSVLVLCVACLPGCGGSGQQATSNGVGDSLAFEGTSGWGTVTLMSWLDPAPGTGDAGHRLVAAQLKLTNTSDIVIESSASAACQLVDDQGQHYPASDAASLPGPALTGALVAPQQSATGWVAFSVPATAHLVRLQYVVTGDSSASAQSWELPQP